MQNTVNRFTGEELARVVAENIKGRRMSLGLTQQQLADRIEFDRVNVTQLENGGRSINLETLAKFASALQVTPEQLLIPGLFLSPGSP